MPPDPSFDELIRRVGGGDEQAAARLVRDFEPVIRRVLRARLRNAAGGANSIRWTSASRCSAPSSCAWPPASTT